MTGGAEESEKQGDQKIQQTSLSFISFCLPFTLLQSHRPQWQEVECLPSDPSGMFPCPVPAAETKATSPHLPHNRWQSETESRPNCASDAIRQKGPMCSHGVEPTSVWGTAPHRWLSCLWSKRWMDKVYGSLLYRLRWGSRVALTNGDKLFSWWIGHPTAAMATVPGSWLFLLCPKKIDGLRSVDKLKSNGTIKERHPGH